MDVVDDYPLLIRQAADADFIAHVQGLIDGNSDKFKPNRNDPERRKFWRFADEIDAAISAKKLELIDRFRIRGWVADPKLHDLIGYISEGAEVHPHTDHDVDNRLHVRINLLVRKPQGGCVPILDNIPIAVGEGDAWVCLASRCRHATTPVEGPTPRSIISYGLQVDRAEAIDLVAQYMVWRRRHQPPAN